MSDSHDALVALVRARRGDEALVSLLATAASRVTAEAQEQATALRQEARHVRHQAWRDLQSAKKDFEAAGRRMMAIRGLELDDELKAVAVRAASRELAKTRELLRRVADAVEAAVARARKAEAQAEDVVRRAAACPEVAACEALSPPAAERREGGKAIDRKPGSGGCSAARHPQGTAPRPAQNRVQMSSLEFTDGAHAA